VERLETVKIIVLGPPLSGKGTQGEKISEKMKLEKFSPGRIFREEIRENTDLGQKISEIINKGYLVDDETVNEIMSSRIISQDSFILDGYPRTMTQALFLENLLKKRKEKIDLVLVILIDKDESIKRAKGRSRADDKSLSILNTRWNEYYNKTVPLIQYYKDNKEVIVIEIDGIGTIDSIEKDIYYKIKCALRAK
jgi:adenylate kinase